MTTVSNTPALDQWHASNDGITAATADSLVPEDRKPAWCEEVAYRGATAHSATMISAPASVALRRHPGIPGKGRGHLELAVAYVDIRQCLTAREPHIGLERWAAADGSRQKIAGSEYSLTLDEAEELARTILLAVATARESMTTSEDE
ncbi:hypothetical protein [Rhodococcus sp. SGAir0479]|uniref:hypothetical protein n=1 Tax=Rhodococcus sp. SGAir0479 TaxID=2567884 RepID=UPI0010CD06CC|nr:hypothetical protein [Rhodococcus sp. SGAir0479]QCQ93032.1 hypothetical protein E7742_18610 [Rhodococcus sp. SGAir0479]